MKASSGCVEMFLLSPVDTRPVYLLTNIPICDSDNDCIRWDKVTRQQITIKRPVAIELWVIWVVLTYQINELAPIAATKYSQMISLEWVGLFHVMNSFIGNT